MLKTAREFRDIMEEVSESIFSTGSRVCSLAHIFTKKNTLIVAALIIAGIILYFILPVAIPLILAFITATALEPLVRLTHQKTKLSRNVGVLLVFLLFLALMLLIGYVITTKVVTEVIRFVENIPIYIYTLNDVWQSLQVGLNNLSHNIPKEFVAEISNQIDQFINNTRLELLTYVNVENVKSFFTYIPFFLVNTLVYMIALFFFMADLPTIRRKFYSYMKDETADKVGFMLGSTTSFFKGFMKAQFLVSIVIFVVTLAGLLMMVKPGLAVVMSLVIWFIDLVPILGSILILAPWALYQFIMGDVVLGLQLSILAAVLLIIRRTLEPKVMGTHIGLSPLAALISLFLGIKLFGVIGVVLGPLAVIIYKSAKNAGIIRTNFKI